MSAELYIIIIKMGSAILAWKIIITITCYNTKTNNVLSYSK